MAKKAKKHATSARKPRPAARGMYLTVHVMPKGAKDESVRVTSFRDITALGHRIAGIVREYLRSIPMLPHVPSWGLSIYPHWTPTSSAPARKSEPGDDSGVPGLDDDDGG